MKRSAPLQRRTPLERTVAFVRPSAPLPRRVGLQSTTPLRKVSAKRRREGPVRKRCVAEVMARDAVCVYPGCTKPSTDPHELWRGQMRALTYLHPDKVRGLCREHHDFITLHPAIGHELGLVKWSWEPCDCEEQADG